MKEKHLNFMGDTQDYKFHPRLANPYGLRGNPDTQANSPDQGDGLNGTPEYENFGGEIQDSGWSNHPGLFGATWSGDGAWYRRNNNVQTDMNDVVLSGNDNNEGDTSTWWSRNFGQDRASLQLTDEERAARNQQRGQNWLSGIRGLTTGFEQGMAYYQPRGTNTNAPVYHSPGTTTTQTRQDNAGLTNSNQVVGYVIIGLAVVGLAVFAISSANKKTTVQV